MNTLVVLLGPTGVGKTALSLHIARRIGSPILSADSRQLYKDLVIGTAAPTSDERAAVTHYLVGLLELTDYYSASRFEEDTLSLLQTLFKQHHAVLMTGGSMMYIDAVCKGIDDIPTVGYKELFAYFDGLCSLDEAVAIICSTRQLIRSNNSSRGRIRPTFRIRKGRSLIVFVRKEE